MFSQFVLNVVGLLLRLRFRAQQNDEEDVEMGRKRVPYSQQKRQVSISLKNSTVESIDLVTTRRSKWIEDAVKLKMNDVSAIEELTTKEVLNILLRITHRTHMTYEEVAVIERLFHRLE